MASFAQTVGTTTATISRVADGTVVPRRDLMHRIYQATNGLVTPDDLLGLRCVHQRSARTDADDVDGRDEGEG